MKEKLRKQVKLIGKITKLLSSVLAVTQLLRGREQRCYILTCIGIEMIKNKTVRLKTSNWPRYIFAQHFMKHGLRVETFRMTSMLRLEHSTLPK